MNSLVKSRKAIEKILENHVRYPRWGCNTDRIKRVKTTAYGELSTEHSTNTSTEAFVNLHIKLSRVPDASEIW